MGCEGSKLTVVNSIQNATASGITQSVAKRMIQNYLLIYVNESIDQHNKDWQKTLAELRNVVNEVVICKEPTHCIQYLNQINDEKAFVISSGTVGQYLVPQIHGMHIVDAIYIFCSDKTMDEEWTKQWSKIQGVFISTQAICESLKTACRQVDHDAIPMCFVQKQTLTTIRTSTQEKNFNQLPPSYMYSCIFKDIVLEIDEDDTKAIKNLLAYCQSQNIQNTELQCFKKEYKSKSALWWYMSQTFVYAMLNHALRTLDTGMMAKMGFFVRNLHKELRQLHEKQSNSYKNKFTVYHGQGLSSEDFQHLRDTEGGLLALNTFVTASTDRFVAMGFITESLRKYADNVGVLFIMKIDPRNVSVSETPFACIDHDSVTKTEKEILFSMHTIFHVGKIKQSTENSRLWEVPVTLTDENDSQLAGLTEYLKKEIEGEGWYRMGQLMLKMGHFDQAEILYNELLKSATNDSDRAYVYHHIGYLKEHQGKNEEAASFFQKSLELKRKTHSSDLSLATTYNNMASMYDNRGDYSKALEFYEKSNRILEKSLLPNDPTLATSYSNIGLVYGNIGDYSNALQFYEKSLTIREKVLPTNHPDLGNSYNNIGDLYEKMGIYSKALEFFEKSNKILERSLPPNHPDLATSYNNIGLLYNDVNDYSKALQFLEKSIKITEKVLPTNHPDLGNSYNNIGLVYCSMKDYSKALEFYTKSLEISEKALPPNHPTLAVLYNNIGMVYESLGDYSKALQSLEKSLKIREKVLPENHPDCATSYNNIGLVYSSMKDYSKALQFYDKSLRIHEVVLPSHHPALATSYKNIGVLYMEMGQYSQALQFLQKSLAISQLSLPSTDPSIEDTLYAINFVKNKI
jgi:tetratricopeptide (TPR) repeat protein